MGNTDNWGVSQMLLLSENNAALINAVVFQYCTTFKILKIIHRILNLDCDKAREDNARLIYYTWASIIYFGHFTVKKTRLSLPAVRYAVGCLYGCNMCLWIKCVFEQTYGKIRGLETVLRLILADLHENKTLSFHK